MKLIAKPVDTKAINCSWYCKQMWYISPQD